MKQATCRQLKGACDEVLTGETAEEMGENSRKHAMAMAEAGDQAHIDAMEAMQAMPQEEQQAWYKNFIDTFDQLEDVE